MSFDVAKEYDAILNSMGGKLEAFEQRDMALRMLESKIRSHERGQRPEAALSVEVVRQAMQDHYWDSLEQNRDIVMAHVDGILRLLAGQPAPQPRSEG